MYEGYVFPPASTSITTNSSSSLFVASIIDCWRDLGESRKSYQSYGAFPPLLRKNRAPRQSMTTDSWSYIVLSPATRKREREKERKKSWNHRSTVVQPMTSASRTLSYERSRRRMTLSASFDQAFGSSQGQQSTLGCSSPLMLAIVVQLGH